VWYSGIGDISQFGFLKKLDSQFRNVDFINVNDDGLDDIFSRISAAIGLEKRTIVIQSGDTTLVMQKQDVTLEVAIVIYCVIFSIDISGSMSGGRWRRLCHGMGGFMDQLRDIDLVGVQTFNHNVQWLT